MVQRLFHAEEERPMSRFAYFLSLTALLGLSAALVGQPGSDAGARPFLGVGVEPAKENGEGVVVKEVAPESPAAKAGLKTGDFILKVNGKDVPDVTEFLRKVGTYKPGDKLSVQIQRDGLDKTITATLGQRLGAAPAPPVVQPGLPKNLLLPQPQAAFLGVRIEPLTAENRKQLRVKAESGAVVKEVTPNSPAAQAGLEVKDVIVAVDGQAVTDPTGLRAAIQKAGPGKDVMLRVQRGEQEKDVRASLRAGGVENLFLDIESLWDQAGKVRDLERRVEALEKRLNELEKRSGTLKK
jgi:C-terminal processing protease CtpA/Prc